MSHSIERVIRERRTIKSFTDQPLSKQTLLDLLNAAVWAPYHSSEEPWRFIIFMNEDRRQFADAVLATYTEDELARFGEGVMKEYCLETPVHLLVVIKQDKSEIRREEALLAAATLIQNLQLLAWEQRIGFVWKTNEYNREADFHRSVGIQTDEKLVGTLHMGYINEDKIPKARRRKSAEDLITWHEGSD
ncbi:nitroreductase [Paenibacillus sp. FSL H8-0537]|uniref:nitroreductase family protein n=1 Tax=Paenibacillus sp. FSL H8-0537 TaxID=2921399 RepID=UPI003100D1D5